MKYLKYLIAILLTAVASFGALFGAQQYGAFNFVASGTYKLAGGGVSSSDTSIAVDNFLKPISNNKYSMSTDFGKIGYATLEPGSQTKKEFISFTGFTYSNNRATLTGVTRGLEFNSPYTASSTLRLSHAGGTTLIISNPPQLYNQLTAKLNDESITGTWNFSSTSPPRLDLAGSAHKNGSYIATTSEFATIEYVNAVALVSAPNGSEAAKGVVELATALESASSTVLGGTGAALVQQARYATDTPQNCTSTSCDVWTKIGGKIRQTFLDLTESWAFTGDVTMANATSTNFGISSIFGWGSLYYSAPGTHNATSTVLSNNGSGALSWNTPLALGAATFLGATTTDTTVADTVTETTYGGGTFATVPANALRSNGAMLVTFNISSLSDAGADDSITLRIKLGGTTVCSQQVSAGSASMAGSLTFLIYADNSTSAQRCINGGIVSDSTGAVVVAARADSTSAIDTTSSLAVTATVQWSQNDGASVETVTLESASVTLLGRQ